MLLGSTSLAPSCAQLGSRFVGFFTHWDEQLIYDHSIPTIGFSMVFSTVWRIPSIHPPLTPRKADVGKVTSICSANLLEDDYVTWIQSIWKGVQERYSSFTLRQLMLLVSMIYYLPAFAVWYLYGSPVVIVGYQKTSHILFLFLCQFLLNFKLAAVLNLGVFLLHYKIRIPTVSCSSMNQPGPGSTKNG